MATATKGKTGAASGKGKGKEQPKESKFESTYGGFKFIGEVVGIGKDNAVNEGTSDKTGADWKSLRFGVKSAPNEVSYVELMGSEQEEFTIKHAKTGEKERMSFEDRFDDLPEGYYMVGVTMALEEEETGKLNKDKTPKMKQKKVTMQAIDAIDYILENLGDGESVYASGNIRYSVYKNEEGEERLQKQFQINYLSKQKSEVDFEDEEFEQTSKFEQTIVISGTEKDENDKNKVHVHALILNVNSQTKVVTTIPASFTIMEEGKTKKLAAKLRSFKFGTVLKVSGDIINKYEEVEVEGDDDWGDSSKGYRKGTTNTRVSEMRILLADPSTLKEKHYSEEDFANEAQETYGEKGKDSDEWGDKAEKGKKKSNKKPKDEDDDDDDDDEEESDGLPF